MIAVNITAVTAVTHAFAHRLVARSGGRVVLFGSIVGSQGVPGQATYAATKAYMQTFAEGLHAELTPPGVDVLALAPGPVHSGFAARAGLTMTSATTADVVAAAALTALGRGARSAGEGPDRRAGDPATPASNPSHGPGHRRHENAGAGADLATTPQQCHQAASRRQVPKLHS